MLQKMIELSSQTARLEPVISFKFLSLWQKELKSHRTTELSQDEKKFHFDTQRLIKNILPSLLDYLEHSEEVSHIERIRLMPLLTKFGSQEWSADIQRLQKCIIKTFGEGRSPREQLIDLTNIIYFCSQTEFTIESELLDKFTSVAPTVDLNDLTHYDLVKFTKVLLKIMPSTFEY